MCTSEEPHKFHQQSWSRKAGEIEVDQEKAQTTYVIAYELVESKWTESEMHMKKLSASMHLQ